METSNKQANGTTARSGVADYAAALRQYKRYGHGRSMNKFCEDEEYDYWKFCRLAREGQIEMEAKSGSEKALGSIEIAPDGIQSRATAEEPVRVCEIRIRFNNGLILSQRGGDVEEVIRAIRKIKS